MRLEPVGELLAVAGHDEQAVVDRQSEPQHGGEVEGEDRDLGHAGDDPQEEHRADDRQAPDREGKSGGNQAPEHDDKQEKGDRERDRLGLDEIRFDVVLHLPVDLGEPADADVDRIGRTSELGRDDLDVLLDLVLVTGDATEHDRLAPVVALERGDAGGPVRIHLPDAFGLRQLLGQRRAGGRDLGVIGVPRLGIDQQDHVRVLDPEALLQGVRRQARLRVRIVEPTGGQPVGDPGPEEPGRREHDDGGDDDDLAPGYNGASKPLEHDPLLRRLPSPHRPGIG